MDEDDQQPDAAAEAFEGVRSELALLRRAVERLAAERAEVSEIPDYSETLGRMAKALNATMQNVGVLAKAAEDNVAPRYVADRIVAAGTHARDEDRRTIATAGSELKTATRDLQGVVASARRGDEQNRWLMWTGIGGIVAGMLLWAALAGVVARAVPSSWLWPETMAAMSLDMPMWEGGQRMMRAASPDAFANIAAGDRIVTANRKALETCRKRASKLRKVVPCTVSVEADKEEQ
jgi:hypothetical protein